MEKLMIQLVFFIIISLGIADTFSVDLESSSIEWVGEKVAGQHDGNINILYGNVSRYLKTDNSMVIDGEFVIDMTSITNNDIASEEYNKYLVDHLNSSDFFDVEKFKTSTLKIVNSDLITNQDSLNNTMITAEITIKGTTQEIIFPAKIIFSKDIATAEGTINIDRTLFDIKYKSKSYFPDIGDKFIYDNFTLNFNITAKKNN